MIDDLALLKDTVREAGERALALRARGLNINHKPGGSPVTNADLEIDAFLKEHLRAARPGYGWLSEETPDNPDRLAHKTVFLSDPIDGTTAFMKDRDWWSICIAVVQDGRPVAGVIFAPSLNQMFEAQDGLGAKFNEQPIRVSPQTTVEDCAMLGDAKMFAHPSWPTPWPPNSSLARLVVVASPI